MGCAVRVDGDRVAGAASRLAEVAQELTLAGEAMARVLQAVADAGGGDALRQAATGAVRQWGSGMGQVGLCAERLAGATAAAGASYRAVEERSSRRWAPGPGERAGWPR